MKDDIKVIITLGFSAILSLMVALAFIALNQLQALNQSMSKLVEETNAKMEAAHTMRDAIRLRANSLKSLQLLEDIFERDDELMRHSVYAVTYRTARDLLVAKGVDEREREIHERLIVLTRAAQPVVDYAAELLMNDAEAKQVKKVVKEASERQENILTVLNELVAVEQENAKQALVTANRHYSKTRYTMLTLVILALLFCVLIALVVIRHACDKNRKIYYQANHDELTGLLNRRAFENQLRAVEYEVNSFGGEHALLYMDLDRFKVVNDTCGHMAGDELLRQVTSLLKKPLRRSDTVARLGGDEFGILLKDCPLSTAMKIAEAMRESVDDFRFSWEEKSFSIGISVGIVPIVRHGGGLNEILSNADLACLVAKQGGRNRVHVAEQDDHYIEQQRGEMKWVRRINEALENNQFKLYCQLVTAIGPDSSEFQLVEILNRMVGLDGKLIMPHSFLGSAERYHLMSAIDKWVFTHTIQWLEEQRPNIGSLKLMINLSGQSLCDDKFMPFILKRLKSSRIPTKHICFEITETAAIANLVKAKEFIFSLRSKGCQFALDDFGSGLSSFTYLKDLPVDYLKIDGLFVKDMTDDPIDCAMVKSINEIGHVMGKKTIAEFVETESILEEVRKLGVDYAQGYGISRPQPIERLMALIDEHASGNRTGSGSALEACDQKERTIASTSLI